MLRRLRAAAASGSAPKPAGRRTPSAPRVRCPASERAWLRRYVCSYVAMYVYIYIYIYMYSVHIYIYIHVYI